MKVCSPLPNVFNGPVQSENVARQLKEISNDYDLLSYVKSHISYFIESQLVNAEWFSRYDSDILRSLHIYCTGIHGINETSNDVNALAIDACIDVKVFNDVCMNIRLFGDSHAMLFLNGRTSTNIKAAGKSTVEVFVSDHAQAAVNLTGNTNLLIETYKTGFATVKNRSRGAISFKGTENLIIK